MHMCWNLFNPLLSWLRAGNGLLKLFTHHCSTEILFFVVLFFFVLICFYLCCVFFSSLPSPKTEVHPLSLLWLNVAYKRSSATLYYLMINMYDIQEPFFTLIICKVYFLVSVVMLLHHTVSGSRKLMEEPPLEFAGTFASLFLFLKGQNRPDNSEWNWHCDCTCCLF